MLIETFEIEETTMEADGTAPEAGAVDAEAMRLAEELGLEGQRSLVVPDGGDGKDRRVPYPRMSKADAAMYGTIFPTKESVVKYRAGILPLRIMQVVAHARGLFDEVQVWHPGDAADPDPILVGKIGSDLFLLARWGTALRTIRELLADARERWIRNRRVECRKAQASATLAEANVEADADKYLAGEWVSAVSYY